MSSWIKKQATMKRRQSAILRKNEQEDRQRELEILKQKLDDAYQRETELASKLETLGAMNDGAASGNSNKDSKAGLEAKKLAVDKSANNSRKTRRNDNSAPKKTKGRTRIWFAVFVVCLLTLGFSVGALLQWQIFGAREVIINHPYCGAICNPQDTPIWQGETKVDRPETPEYGSTFGQIDIDKINFHNKIKLGTDLGNLSDMSTAMYSKSVLPGDFGMTLIGGHSGVLDQTLNFGNLEHIDAGDEIKITTSWGTYIYRVIDRHVEKADAYPVEDKLKQNDRRFAVFYTCYPNGRLNTPDRTFVEADLVSGPAFN